MSLPRTQSIRFLADGIRLSGVLHAPACQPQAVIIGCHGLMADKMSPKQIDLAKRCTAASMAYFRFDHRGCGESGGDFECDTTLGNRIADLKSAFHRVRSELGDAIPVGLFGSSLGGTVCLAAAGEIKPFAIVTLAAPVSSRAIRMPPDTPQALRDDVFQHRMSFDIAEILARVHHMLVIHGSADETVSVENAHTIHRLAHNPKRLLILEGGDHRITDAALQKTYMHEVLGWFAACIPSGSERG